MGGIRVIDTCFLAKWLLFLRFLFGLAFVSILRITYSPSGDPITYNEKGPRPPQFQRFALECLEVCLLDLCASISVVLYYVEQLLVLAAQWRETGSYSTTCIIKQILNSWCRGNCCFSQGSLYAPSVPTSRRSYFRYSTRPHGLLVLYNLINTPSPTAVSAMCKTQILFGGRSVTRILAWRSRRLASKIALI